MTTVSLENFSKHYGAMKAVDSVSLCVAEGSVVALLGPSGCGKTTTLRAIAGLVAPTSGVIRIGEQIVNDLPIHRRNVGMLFQNYALFPHMTVFDNVAFGLRTRLRSKARVDVNSAVARALDLVQMGDLAKRYPAQLSGGQQQRVALARALIIEPSVLLLDEPFGALDRRLRQSMQIEIRALISRLGLTTILVTHDQEEAFALADRIAVMNNGTIAQIGPPSELYSEPSSAFVADFLGTANLFEGNWIDNANDEQSARLICDGVVIDSASRPASRNGSGLVAIRPERMTVTIRPIGSASNAIGGVVEQVVFLGAATMFRVQTSTRRIITIVRLNDAADCDLSLGDKVTVSWPPEAVVPLGPSHPIQFIGRT